MVRTARKRSRSCAALCGTNLKTRVCEAERIHLEGEEARRMAGQRGGRSDDRLSGYSASTKGQPVMSDVPEEHGKGQHREHEFPAGVFRVSEGIWFGTARPQDLLPAILRANETIRWEDSERSEKPPDSARRRRVSPRFAGSCRGVSLRHVQELIPIEHRQAEVGQRQAPHALEPVLDGEPPFPTMRRRFGARARQLPTHVRSHKTSACAVCRLASFWSMAIF